MEQPIVIENLDAVKKRLLNAGFGNRFDQAIEEALTAGKTQIKLFTSEMIENQKMDFEPEVNIKEGKGYYNGFKATLHHNAESSTEHWFKANDRIMINEAFILLVDQQHPRSVHKTYYDEAGEKYGQWLQLDFTQKTESGNFLTKRYGDYDMVAKLNDYEFVELSSLKNKVTAAAYMAEGREIELTPVNQEKYKQVYVMANPERNTITILDNGGKLLYHDQFRTAEACQRIQQERNTKESNKSFVRTPVPGKPAGGDIASQDAADPVKKKNSSDSSEALKSNKKSRVVKEIEIKKGKSL